MGKKQNSYLTCMIQNELITDMGQHIQNNIVNMISNVIYNVVNMKDMCKGSYILNKN